METREILPGVRLTACTTEKFKTGYFSINFLRPLDRAEAAMNAVLPRVLLRGTETHPDLQSLSVTMEELYGTEISTLVRKKGEVQAWGLCADFIEDAMVGDQVFEPAAALAAELLLRPVTENGVFREDYVQREKEILLDAIASVIDNKRTYAMAQMTKTMHRDEAFSVDRLGEKAEAEKIAAAPLYDHYRRALAGSRVEILYVGRRTADQAAETFRRVLGDLPRGEIAPVGTVHIPRAAQVQNAEEAMDVTQGVLCMGYRIGFTGADRRWPALMMLNAVFGAGVTSKLFVNVREKQSLCYYASSMVEKHKGEVMVNSGISFDKKELVVREIEKQLEDCRQGKISEQELESARKQILSALKATADFPNQLESFYLSQRIGEFPDTPGNLAEAVAAVTAEDVAAAARELTLDTVYFLKGAEA